MISISVSIIELVLNFIKNFITDRNNWILNKNYLVLIGLSNDLIFYVTQQSI